MREHLRTGFLVVVTGSKFAGGPPFAGAVLVPPSIVRRLDRIVLPSGLASYCARNDWPAALRARSVGSPFGVATNIGLGLRWEAALAELDRYDAVAPTRRDAIASAFAILAADAIDAVPGLERLPDSAAAPDRPPSIIPILTRGRAGEVLCAKALHQALMTPASRRSTDLRVFHVGQPVAVGSAAALRICLAAPQVSDVAARMSAGLHLAAAMAPLFADLNALLETWAEVRHALNPSMPARRVA